MNKGRPVDVALVTCAELPRLTDDDRPVAEALQRRGLRVEPVSWDDAGFDWSSARLACIRSTWDYSTRHAEFLEWIGRASSATSLWNPRPVLEWNTHKSYLGDLGRAGIEVADTVMIGKGGGCDLLELAGERGWEDAVVKPAVSGTARETIRLSEQGRERAQQHLDRLLEAEDVLVQEYVGSVAREGELALMFLDGKFSHAVRKRARAGDFRVLEEWGGETVPAEVSADELAFAERTLAQSPAETLYARVDLWRGRNGNLLVAELELVEPELYFRHGPPEAPARLAQAILARLGPG